MFAFCRYIKVSNSKTLIDFLSNIWIGKLRLHANVARFDRNAVVKPPHVGAKVEPLAANKAPASDQKHSFSNKMNTYAYVAKAVSDERKGGTKVVNDDGEESNSIIELQNAGTNPLNLRDLMWMIWRRFHCLCMFPISRLILRNESFGIFMVRWEPLWMFTLPKRRTN